MKILGAALTVALVATTTIAGADSAADVRWFQDTEQALMDAIAVGDRRTWDRIMDAGCIVTTEEGEVMAREKFLSDLRPLPPGLSGTIAVRDLTVQEFPAFAIVRFLADERETVFGQQLATKYRITDAFRRSGSTWKMVASHVAVVTIDPPAQPVARDGWPGLVGKYQLAQDGWTFHVVLRDGQLLGGRDPEKLKRLIPLTPYAFALEGSLGEWLFVVGADGKAIKIVNLRKFEPLVWTRVSGS
jgi:hypothetical protein